MPDPKIENGNLVHTAASVCTIRSRGLEADSEKSWFGAEFLRLEIPELSFKSAEEAPAFSPRRYTMRELESPASDLVLTTRSICRRDIAPSLRASGGYAGPARRIVRHLHAGSGYEEAHVSIRSLSYTRFADEHLQHPHFRHYRSPSVRDKTYG